MISQEYLPLAYLNAWEYCPRRFYFEHILGEMADNEHILLGRHIHRNIDAVNIIKEGEKTIYQQQWVWHDRLQIAGIIDAVEVTGNDLYVPIEYKKGKMANHLNDHFQLCAAALCLEERLNKSISYGDIFYYGNRRRQRVKFTSALRAATENAIVSARVAGDFPMPPPLDRRQKCQACSLQGICLPSEVKQLRQDRSTILDEV
jgi:CRISPR-associated exonuclease Cas4